MKIKRDYPNQNKRTHCHTNEIFFYRPPNSNQTHTLLQNNNWLPNANTMNKHNTLSTQIQIID